MAESGYEALGFMTSAHAPFDLILTDHNMPGMSGLDLVRSLREKRFEGKIIVTTGCKLSIDERRYKKLDVAGIMEKPFDLAVIREWMDCIQECRKRLSAIEVPPCPPGAIRSCWLRKIIVRFNMPRSAGWISATAGLRTPWKV